MRSSSRAGQRSSPVRYTVLLGFNIILYSLICRKVKISLLHSVVDPDPGESVSFCRIRNSKLDSYLYDHWFLQIIVKKKLKNTRPRNMMT